MAKAQSSPSSYIALLVFVIGVILIFYVLMLPPEDRADLLEQNRTTGVDGKNQITVLKTESPGTINNVAEDTIYRELSSINLYTQTEATTLTTFDSLHVMKSLFEEQQHNISFSITDKENTDNIVLSFNTPIHKGRLTIILNDMMIMSDEVNTQSPTPITLPRDYLKPNNVLLFKVNSPGIIFWDANEFSIKNLKVVADVTDRSNQASRQIMVITEEEYDNIEYMEMSFLVECRTSGVMHVYLNKYEMFRGGPDCGYPMKLPPVDKKRVREGENELLFTTDSGNFMLDQIEMKMKMKEPVFPKYYFYLNEEIYNKVKDNSADINVTLIFPNDVDRKKGTLYVNGVFFEINTYDMDFNKNMNQFIRKGNNIIEIRPDTKVMDILELQILLAE